MQHWSTVIRRIALASIGVLLSICALVVIIFIAMSGGPQLAPAGAALGTIVPGLAILAVAVALYFLPAIVASRRDHPNAASIMLLNLLLGWTLLGWIGALVWSASAISPPPLPTPQATPANHSH